jgi:hypothetical protein
MPIACRAAESRGHGVQSEHGGLQGLDPRWQRGGGEVPGVQGDDRTCTGDDRGRDDVFVIGIG